MTKIMVTGAQGQLGSCIRNIAKQHTDKQWQFYSKEQLDITNKKAIQAVFELENFDFCINAAGFTNVEKAESEVEKAFELNAEALRELSLQCKEHQTTLIHLSTDYVFDGRSKQPYLETDSTRPLNVYGTSKRKGEVIIEESGCRYIIIRTSWLYSQHGHNFLKTVLRFAADERPMKITTEQTGTPTNANDLAQAIMVIVENIPQESGIYHISNTGEATWYDFAEEIIANTAKMNHSVLQKTDHYPTFAERPSFSVLNCNKYCSTFDQTLPNWKNSLKSLLLEHEVSLTNNHP
ncbi:MAG: dTDP-4-dehydrorhamnose reductase [Flavobacteriaceae bacterium]|nr:dTDP-4-dehydrorhamnose reductase [Flavobacteriaceae bacterium]